MMSEAIKRVVCIDASPAGCGLEKEKTYTVLEDDGLHYILAETTNMGGWFKTRFRDAPALQCVDCMLLESEEPSVCKRTPDLQARCNYCAHRKHERGETLRTSASGPSLAGDAAARKAAPMFEGLIGYFPNALAAVANVSKVGNDQHNPGLPMQWAYNKSTDARDCILRHLCEAGTVDTDGLLHSAKVAWRALDALERELLKANPHMKPGVNVTGFVRGAK